MSKREIKDLLYEHVSRIAKAASSPKRLELLDMLAQGEKSVEALATELSIDVKLASAHLKALKEGRLVSTRKAGKFVYYRLSGPAVGELCVVLKNVAQAHLVELRSALEKIASAPDKLSSCTRQQLLEQARRGEVVVIDVRPRAEFDHSHLPFARSMPLQEITQRISELPPNVEIVAYCRGPFCLFAQEAARLLQVRGCTVSTLHDGVSEWQVAGMPLESIFNHKELQ